MVASTDQINSEIIVKVIHFLPQIQFNTSITISVTGTAMIKQNHAPFTPTSSSTTKVIVAIIQTTMLARMVIRVDDRLICLVSRIILGFCLLSKKSTLTPNISAICFKTLKNTTNYSVF